MTNKTKLVTVTPRVAMLTERDVGKTPVLECIDLGISFGGLKAVDNFNITIGRTEIAGLIGPNGAGKTTVFNLLTSVYQPTHGTILLDGKDIHGMSTAQINHAGIARTFQNIRLFSNLTVEENITVADQIRPREQHPAPAPIPLGGARRARARDGAAKHLPHGGHGKRAGWQPALRRAAPP